MPHPKTHVLNTFSAVPQVLIPDNEPWQVELHDPAISVMTDFRLRSYFRVSPEDTIDEALQKMKVAGLRFSFVIDGKSQEILGSISSYDIMGEKPMRYLQSVGFADNGVTHKDIKVRDIMEKVSDWECVELDNVETCSVQSLLDAFQKSGRTHLPVLTHGENNERRLCGLFSSAKVLRLTDFARQKASPHR